MKNNENLEVKIHFCLPFEILGFFKNQQNVIKKIMRNSSGF